MIIIDYQDTIYRANVDYNGLSLGLKISSNKIFTYDSLNGITYYYKDREFTNYQYTEDEIIMLKLKAKTL